MYSPVLALLLFDSEGKTFPAVKCFPCVHQPCPHPVCVPPGAAQTVFSGSVSVVLFETAAGYDWRQVWDWITRVKLWAVKPIKWKTLKCQRAEGENSVSWWISSSRGTVTRDRFANAKTYWCSFQYMNELVLTIVLHCVQVCMCFFYNDHVINHSDTWFAV